MIDSFKQDIMGRGALSMYMHKTLVLETIHSWAPDTVTACILYNDRRYASLDITSMCRRCSAGDLVLSHFFVLYVNCLM